MQCFFSTFQLATSFNFYNTSNSFQDITTTCLSVTKCPFGVLPIGTKSRDKFSNEPFITSTLKLPISWKILPATVLSKFSTGFFFFFSILNGFQWHLLTLVGRNGDIYHLFKCTLAMVNNSDNSPSNGHVQATNTGCWPFLQLGCRQRTTQTGELLTLNS